MAQQQPQGQPISQLQGNQSFVNYSYGPTGPFMPAPYSSYGNAPLQQAPYTVAARPETVSTIYNPQQLQQQPSGIQSTPFPGIPFQGQGGPQQQFQPQQLQQQPLQGATILTGSQAPQLQQQQQQPFGQAFGPSIAQPFGQPAGLQGFTAGPASDWQFNGANNSMFRTQPLFPFYDQQTRTPMYANHKDASYEKIDNNAFYLRVDPNIRGGATNSATGLRGEGVVNENGEYVYTYNRQVIADGPVPVTRHPFARETDPRRGLVEYFVENRGGRKN